MEDFLRNFPSPQAPDALQIAHALRSSGYRVLICGGSVRDYLLGRTRPEADIDLATSARPEEIARLFPEALPVGAQFGVMMIPRGGKNIELATFRRDAEYLDGRHPSEVSYAGEEEDARRRDFTVNAMFLDPFTGAVLDYVNGRADLERGILRTVGSPGLRFSEDRLRILRAVRFAVQLNFSIEPETWEGVRSRSREVTSVSHERVRVELEKIFISGRGDKGLDLLRDAGLLRVLLPEVQAMIGVQQPPQYHPEGDVYEHTRLMFTLAGEMGPALAWAVLLHDVGKPPTFQVKERIRFDGHVEIGMVMAREIGRRLRMENALVDDIVDLVEHHLRFMHVREMREARLKRFLRKANFADHLELHRLDCLGSHGMLDNYEFCQHKLLEFGSEAMHPPRLVSGDDLIALGMRPGPAFREILADVEDRQLEGSLATKDDAIAYVQSHWAKQ